MLYRQRALLRYTHSQDAPVHTSTPACFTGFCVCQRPPLVVNGISQHWLAGAQGNHTPSAYNAMLSFPAVRLWNRKPREPADRSSSSTGWVSLLGVKCCQVGCQCRGLGKSWELLTRGGWVYSVWLWGRGSGGSMFYMIRPWSTRPHHLCTETAITWPQLGMKPQAHLPLGCG